MTEFANEVPMRVIGMLLGIPEADQAAIRERADAKLRTEAGRADEGVRKRAHGQPTSSPTTSTGGPSTPPTTS